MTEEALEFALTAVPKMRRGEHVRYVANHRSFGAFMKSEQMRDVTAEAAGDIATAAEAKTPLAKSDAQEHTGLHARVRAGFRVQREAGLAKISGNLRVQVNVVNDEPGAALVEFGARGLDRVRMLGEAGAMFGDLHTGEGDALG